MHKNLKLIKTRQDVVDKEGINSKKELLNKILRAVINNPQIKSHNNG